MIPSCTSCCNSLTDASEPSQHNHGRNQLRRSSHSRAVDLSSTIQSLPPLSSIITAIPSPPSPILQSPIDPPITRPRPPFREARRRTTQAALPLSGDPSFAPLLQASKLCRPCSQPRRSTISSVHAAAKPKPVLPCRCHLDATESVPKLTATSTAAISEPSLSPSLPLQVAGVISHGLSLAVCEKTKMR